MNPLRCTPADNLLKALEGLVQAVDDCRLVWAGSPGETLRKAREAAQAFREAQEKTEVPSDLCHPMDLPLHPEQALNAQHEARGAIEADVSAIGAFVRSLEARAVWAVHGLDCIGRATENTSAPRLREIAIQHLRALPSKGRGT